jgi:hypothetical protein
MKQEKFTLPIDIHFRRAITQSRLWARRIIPWFCVGLFHVTNRNQQLRRTPSSLANGLEIAILAISPMIGDSEQLTATESHWVALSCG